MNSRCSVLGFYIDSNVNLSTADDLEVLNCEINGAITTSSSNYSENNLIENNIVNGGINGSYFRSTVIVGCVIIGTFNLGNDNFLLGNRWKNMDPSSGSYAIEIRSGSIATNNLFYITGNTDNVYVHDSAVFEHNVIVPGTDEIIPETLWRNNIIYSEQAPSIDGKGNLIGNPIFADFAGEDYHLGTGSPAIDGGKGLDADGSTADIGMYGGVRAGVWNPVQEEAGRPVVGQLIVTPNPVAPGEPLRLRFTARSNP